jgi:hypothetical protein
VEIGASGLLPLVVMLLVVMELASQRLPYKLRRPNRAPRVRAARSCRH